MNKIENVREAIVEASAYNKSKSDTFGEVFTPFELIEEMLDKLDPSVWSDKTKTFFDPCAGKGNFPICIVKRLFDGLANVIPDAEERLRHIVEKQLFMSEMQRVSAEFIREHFTFGIEGLRPNLYHGNTLEMPVDWFDKPLEEREKILKENPNGYKPNKGTNLFDLFS
jgi:type I restriction-modification system DNA methylase subunit